MGLKEEIQSLIKGEVADDKDILEIYSRDASLFKVSPQLVVFPKDVEDIKNLVSFVTLHKLSLTCRGGGSDMTGGPLSESLVLDMTRFFNQIKEIRESFAVVQPGVFYRDFEREILKHNLVLPCFPASKNLCTLGGMVANNAGGEKSLLYGKTSNFVQELKVVLSDGNIYSFCPIFKEELESKISQNNFEGFIYKNVFQLIQANYDILKEAKPRTSKNSAGYALWDVWEKEKGIFDLTKLFVGSQGTLGIITEIKFRLISQSKHSVLLVIFLPSLDPLVETVHAVLSEKPESFESYDDYTLKLAVRFFPDFLKTLRGNIISLALQFLPEFFMVLRGGMPKLVLLAEFTGDDPTQVKEKAEKAKKKVMELGVFTRIATDKKEIAKYLAIRRESFNLLRRHPHGLRTAPFIDDIIVDPQTLEDFLPRLNKILSRYPKLIYTIAGHVGDGNFHIIPLMDFKDPQIKTIIPELSREVYQLVFEFKGSMTAEHNDGLIRTPFLKDMYGEKISELFAKVKNIFDPKDIFNPGKKVGGDLDYALNHLALV